MENEKDLNKILLSEIQHLERLLQDLIIQRNTNTRRQIVANEDREFFIREGENVDIETEWKREEELLKSIIENKKKEFRCHIAATDKDSTEKVKKQSAFLKSSNISIFQNIDEEKFCSSLPLVNLTFDCNNNNSNGNLNGLLNENHNNHENHDTVNNNQEQTQQPQQPSSSSSSPSSSPQIDISTINNNNIDKMLTIEGPIKDSPSDCKNFKSVVYCRSGSSYPKHHVSGRRQGDPICDKFKVSIYKDRLIASLADGCNWGRLPFEAANNATDAFIRFLEENHREINTIRKAGSYLLSAMTCAHKGIVAGKSEVWEAGTTTLIGGILMKIDQNLKRMSTITQNIDVQGATWAFMGVTLGDCKAFHYSSKSQQFSDITKGNRMNVTDARDPGGRLGPYIGNGDPDLRNLSVFYKLCDEDDIIMLLSDGVHDNLDPQQLGISPVDLGLQGVITWDEAGQKLPLETENVKNDFRKNWLSEHFQTPEQLQPSYISETLLKHCTTTTQSSRDFMETNTTSKLPSDYKLYPGKMDHNTCVCFRVGNFN